MLKPSRANAKQDLETYINQATILIHSPETKPKILKSLSGPDPVKQVATVAAMIISRIDSATRSKGVEVSDAVKIVACTAVVALLTELAHAARLYTLNSNLVQLAAATAGQLYFKNEVQAKRVDPAAWKQHVGQSLMKMPPEKRQKAEVATDTLMATAQQYKNGKIDTSWKGARRGK